MKAVPWLALVVSLAGALVAAGAYWRVRSAAPPSSATGSAEVESLKARIAVLEGDLRRTRDRVASLEQPPKPDGVTAHDHSDGHETGDIADLKRRIEQLERQAMTGRTVPTRPGGSMPANPAMIEREKTQLSDTRLPERTRANSLGRLKLMGAHKTDDVIEVALGLLSQSRETNIRTLVIRGFQGAENTKLIPPLLALLKGDPDEDVRDESARVLGEYLAQPEAKSALEQAAAEDASDKVKRRAQAMLAATPKSK